MINLQTIDDSHYDPQPSRVCIFSATLVICVAGVEMAKERSARTSDREFAQRLNSALGACPIRVWIGRI
jgi:hypothetical protein